MKPILFNTEMVRAILDGRKSVTRRVVKPQLPDNVVETYEVDPLGFMTFRTTDRYLGGYRNVKCQYAPGDILYVREAWTNIMGKYLYRADFKDRVDWPWRPSIHMPKEAARLFLLVTRLWAERVRDIIEAQAREEGFSSRAEFLEAFLKMYPGCNEDSWVWAIALERCEKPEGDTT